MYGAAGIRPSGIRAVVAVLATVLVAAGCGTGAEPAVSRTDRPAGTTPSTGTAPSAGTARPADRTGSAGTSAPSGPSTASPASAASPVWEFEHVEDGSGDLTDVAALAEDDIWAIGTGNSMDSDAYLLHYDGTRWKREPVPGAVGAVVAPLVLEGIGDRALWLGQRTQQWNTAGNSWAKWDGTRWSAVPNPPPGPVGDLAATGPDDIWTLEGQQSVHHWDGTRWTTTRLPYRTTDLAAAGPRDAWAVGSRSTGPGTEGSYGLRYSQPASMHWDGTGWKPVETPQVHFGEPLPPEPSAGLDQVLPLDGGGVLAYGTNTFNHGEGGDEPAEGRIRLRWNGSRWTEQEPAPGECAARTPVGQDGKGLFLDGNWYLTDDGACVKVERQRLPASTGAREESKQSLWLSQIHRLPGTRQWLGSGYVRVRQSDGSFNAPVVVRLKRGG